MLPLLRSEVFRLSRRLMPRILLLILVAIVILLYVVITAVSSSPPKGSNLSGNNLENARQSVRLANIRVFGFSLMESVGTILVVILASSIVATEYSWGTIRPLAAHVPRRSSLISAKLLTIFAFLLLLVLVGLAAALLGSGLGTLEVGSGVGLGSAWLPHTLAALARVIYVMLPYAALAFLVALWTKSSAAGISVGLAVLFLDGVLTGLIGLAGGDFKRIGDVFIARNVSAIMQANSYGLPATDPSSTTDLPNIWQAAAVLLAYISASVALAYWRFTSRDITSG